MYLLTRKTYTSNHPRSKDSHDLTSSTVLIVCSLVVWLVSLDVMLPSPGLPLCSALFFSGGRRSNNLFSLFKSEEFLCNMRLYLCRSRDESVADTHLYTERLHPWWAFVQSCCHEEMDWEDHTHNLKLVTFYWRNYIEVLELNTPPWMKRLLFGFSRPWFNLESPTSLAGFSLSQLCYLVLW